MKFATVKHTQQTIPGEPITFEHDGHQVTAHPPTPAQYALFLAAYDSLDGGLEQVTDIINFFFCLFDGESLYYFRSRFWDRTDSFDMLGDGGMVDVLNAVLPIWKEASHSAQGQALSH